MDIRYEGHSEVVYKRSPPPVIDLEQQLLQSKRECQLLDAGGMRFKSEHLESSSSVLGRYVCCSVLQCVTVCCSVLQCVAVCCSVLECVAVYCSVLQCITVYCSVLQCVVAAGYV